MNSRVFDTFTRHAASVVPRRTSLLTLGGAALATNAAVAHPGFGAARKKSGNTCKKKAKQRCANDAAACRARLLAFCEDFPPADECAAPVNPCCDTCSANEFLVCYRAYLTGAG